MAAEAQFGHFLYNKMNTYNQKSNLVVLMVAILGRSVLLRDEDQWTASF